ncbi:hypothetical protein [Streptomyces hygroscopicus]|uniref:hypothetical protein n=1 Tax=Streptomyces hygroscopicus TaxID=1912 RepID=UPI001BDE0401|nr:hypothetical protein [Streptomyces hygroscopicus]MBW8087222.1 hypothetical protein [Streptomyces hygroscopicus subsp. hygroscopicus]
MIHESRLALARPLFADVDASEGRARQHCDRITATGPDPGVRPVDNEDTVRTRHDVERVRVSVQKSGTIQRCVFFQGGKFVEMAGRALHRA